MRNRHGNLHFLSNTIIAGGGTQAKNPGNVLGTNHRSCTSWSTLAFGQARVEVEIVTNNLRFPGQYFDAETGLHYNWHRYYAPRMGRYLRTDPIGFNGGLNPFIYVGSNPVNTIDPWGLKYVDSAWYPANEPDWEPLWQPLKEGCYQGCKEQCYKEDPARVFMTWLCPAHLIIDLKVWSFVFTTRWFSKSGRRVLKSGWKHMWNVQVRTFGPRSMWTKFDGFFKPRSRPWPKSNAGFSWTEMQRGRTVKKYAGRWGTCTKVVGAFSCGYLVGSWLRCFYRCVDYKYC
ncbi:MAG: RHS repeat-associated core domain-containing protein [bacterium]|nr:RHS repeat-associated core domain-containing protein [bacterium]